MRANICSSRLTQQLMCAANAFPTLLSQPLAADSLGISDVVAFIHNEWTDLVVVLTHVWRGLIAFSFPHKP